MQLALGKTVEDEQLPNLHLLSMHMQGETGLLFTDKKQDDVLKFFKTHKVQDFARPGNKATETVVIKEGPLPSISYVSEDQLRKLGLPIELKRGVIHLLHDYPVCKKGEILNPQQTRLVKLLGKKMANFHVILSGVWTKDNGWQELTRTVNKSNAQKKHKPGKAKAKKSSKLKEESMELDAEASDQEEGVEEDGVDEQEENDESS
ncbi:hypothetical protein C0Q70_07602 [Pomacea canaliculata]|uniref:Large ribosomal subunit protein uL10-like insertion domain-containing protein n=2 Tax=Pomacea canaliculata TaxID=400727 RepID=A0A2T7PFH8_POMCA|nr:hypothetical protein C0Q70_07602 [Pomacea canaliculata]